MKMVILLKSWRGKIVVKLFTTFGPKSWSMNLLRNIPENIPRCSRGTLEKILGIVPRKFPGIGSEELFAGNSK